ncbi:hypothetical protein [Allorhizocola rhizosphaerae]|uniref:hypothetical protein n=1 Tax=Allorhizocola rhizosphaerae TaxID=1872709 RepID=UPI000E3C4B94|nr:hypothetical protein [Allorhizocola rhizosphaerae]
MREQEYLEPHDYLSNDDYQYFREKDHSWDAPTGSWETEFDEGGGRIPRSHRLEPATRGWAGRRRWLLLIAVGGLAVGTLLCVMPFMWGSDPAPQGALPAPLPAMSPEISEEPLILPDLPLPSVTSASPTPRSPSAAPSTTASVSPTPTPTRSPDPVLLGPSSGGGVENMVQRYCDRHSGGSADALSDGRWRCVRLLSSSAVDLNVACRDSYGTGAYARSTRAGDPYAWRCYR